MEMGKAVSTILLLLMAVLLALQFMGMAEGNLAIQVVASSGVLLCCGISFGWHSAGRNARAAEDADAIAAKPSEPPKKKVNLRRLSKRLKRRRENKGWSQLDLSRAAYVGIAAIEDCENEVSVPSDAILSRLAEALNCSVADLTGEGCHRSFAATHGGRS